MKDFVETLLDLMKENELNSKQLSKAVKISESTICGWLTFVNSISLKHLITLADYFQCSTDFLIGRSDSYTPFTPQYSVPFSKRIRQIMEEKGYTRYRFIKETRFTEAHVYKWDKGSIPQLPTLIELADLFNCSVDYLIGRE